jgi:hypothetical protein
VDELATKLGPEYIALMNGLQDMDPDSEEGKEIGSTLEALDKLCASSNQQLEKLCASFFSSQHGVASDPLWVGPLYYGYMASVPPRSGRISIVGKGLAPASPVAAFIRGLAGFSTRGRHPRSTGVREALESGLPNTRGTRGAPAHTAIYA